MAQIDLRHPLGLVQQKANQGFDFVPVEKLNHNLRELMNLLHPRAQKQWFEFQHPGWQFFNDNLNAIISNEIDPVPMQTLANLSSPRNLAQSTQNFPQGYHQNGVIDSSGS